MCTTIGTVLTECNTVPMPRSALLGRGVLAVSIALYSDFAPLSPALYVLLAALPVYAVGLYEDITRRVSPRKRLLAAVVSAALASANHPDGPDSA